MTTDLAPVTTMNVTTIRASKKVWIHWMQPMTMTTTTRCVLPENEEKKTTA
jgi:hypothetical protein